MGKQEWANRTEQYMLKQQYDRMRAFPQQDPDHDGASRLSRSQQRHLIEAGRRPGWFRRTGWLTD